MGRLRRWVRRSPDPATSDKLRLALTTERQKVRALKDQVASLESAAARFRPLAAVAEDGTTLAVAFVDFVRTGRRSGSREYVRAYCHALMEDPDQHSLGCLGFAVFLTGEELFVAAESFFHEAGSEVSSRAAPVEYFLARFEVDAEAAEGELEHYLASGRERVSHAQHLQLLNVFAKHLRLAPLIAELPHLVDRETADPQLDAGDARLLRWIQDRVAEYGRPAPALDPGTVSLAVMDYKLLDRRQTSSNRGDYVQTLAALANVCRFSDVEFVGDDELPLLLTELQGEVSVERRISGVAARVQPIALDRDFSSSRRYPDNTWLICNGWFMHRNYRGDIDFPFPESVNPLFLSFHIQDPYLLTDAVASRLKPYEPIGCRDWTTVYRLADVGVKAFFSGCITTTVSLVMPPAMTTEPDLVVVVEAATTPEDLNGTTALTVKQTGDHVRDLALHEGVRDARSMLAGYQAASRVITRRLHCYLPCLSMGLDVDFRPKNLADIRFEGLLSLSPDGVATMRTGLEDRLEAVFRAIFTGGSRDEVMSLWRELAAPDVEAADAYRATYPAPPPSSIDLPAVVAEAQATAVHRTSGTGAPPDVTVAFAIDQNLKDQLAVVLQSLADRTSAQVHVHLLGRGLQPDYYERLHRLLPQLDFTFYDFSRVDYGDKLSMLDHITVSTMDRLFLPELLQDLDKVLYLDADILVDHDVAELFAIDLGENVVAAKKSNVPRWKSMVRIVTQNSLTLPPERAWEMRRRLHHTHDLRVPTFNAGVLLLNLRVMREERFTERYVYLVEEEAFNDQDALNVFAGSRVVSLAPEWNHVPNQDRVETPRIIHWAGPCKPWNDLYIWGKPRYESVLARVTDPAG